MENFLEIIARKPECNFTETIDTSEFLEGLIQTQDTQVQKPVATTTQSSYMKFIECVFSLSDPYYSQISSSERPMHIKQTLMKWCSELDEQQQDTYTIHGWNPKVVGVKHLQRGLQEAASNNALTMSQLCYLTETYKTHFVLVYDSHMYETTWKPYKKTLIEYTGKSYNIYTKECDTTQHRWISDLPEFVNDIKKGTMYKIELDPISKYKSGDLKELAKSYEISLVDNTHKPKAKQVLYDDIAKHLTKML